MKRDMDLVREILLAIEKAGGGNVQLRDIKVSGYDIHGDVEHAWEYDYHIRILVDAGLITAEYSKRQERHTPDDRDEKEMLIVSNNAYQWVSPIGLTWRGHELLDSIRDPKIWKETKMGAKKFGGLSLELLGELAKGLIKKKIEDHTGIKL